MQNVAKKELSFKSGLGRSTFNVSNETLLRTCPFCEHEKATAAHVASHIRRIACFALPRSANDESHDQMSTQLSDGAIMDSESIGDNFPGMPDEIGSPVDISEQPHWPYNNPYGNPFGNDDYISWDNVPLNTGKAGRSSHTTQDAVDGRDMRWNNPDLPLAPSSPPIPFLIGGNTHSALAHMGDWTHADEVFADELDI